MVKSGSVGPNRSKESHQAEASRQDMNTGLAFGDCARSTSDSQNLAVLPKRHDNSLFLRKTVGKLLWTLLVVNLRIPGLI